MDTRSCFIAFIVGYCLSFGNAEISDFFGAREMEAIKLSATATLSHPATLGDAYFSAKILRSVDTAGYSCNCAAIDKLFNQASSNLDIYYGVASSQACSCNLEVSSNFKSDAINGLKSRVFTEFAGSALACGAIGLIVDEDIVAKLRNFMTSDGTFRSTLESKKSSIQNTKLALQVLSSYADKTLSSVLNEFAESILPLLPVGDDKSAVDPCFLAPLSRISAKKPKLVGTRLSAIANSLLQLRYSSNLETIANVIESLKFISTYKASPLYFTFRSPVMSSDAMSKILVVDAVDIFGNPSIIKSVEVKAIKRSGRDASLFSGLFEGNSLDLAGVDGMVAGLFSADLLLTVDGQTKPVVSSLAFVIRGKLEVVNVAVGVSPSKQVSMSDLAVVSEQNSVETMSASAVSGDFVHVAFSVSSSSKSSERFQKPHQVFVKLTHEESGASSFFVGAADGKLGEGTGSKYRASISLSKEVGTLMHASGIYTMTLLVSDVAYGFPIEWVVGSIELLLPGKIVKDSPLYTKPLMYTSDNTLKALPEIFHVMKPDSKRASAFMSTIFTALTAAPLILFIGFILFLNPNLKRLQSVSSFLFVACLLLTLFLYAGYWLALEGVSFYDTIKYLCFLVPTTIIIGSSAVSSVADIRLSEITKRS